MRPQYRFTLDGNKVISEPIGWNQMIIELNRDKKYWSLVESIELPLMFYGNSADGDGGYEYLKGVRLNGPDSQVEILVEISWDFGVTWETFFSGMLDLTELIDMETDRKFQCTTIRTSAWSRFINRQAVPVDVTAIATEQTLSLPNQEVRQLYVGIHSDDISYVASPYGIIDWKIVQRSEINIKSNLPRVASTSLPVDLFEMQYEGYYTFTGDVYVASSATFPSNQITDLEVRIQINNDTPIAWTMEQLGTNGVDGRTHFYYDVQHHLQKGDQVRIYFFATDGSSTFVWSDFVLQGLSVIADTLWPPSTTDSYFIHDVGRAIITEITGEEYFYSEYFGGVNTQNIDYDEDGCGVFFRLMKGRHIRGTPASFKPFSMSWDELWEGIDPIFMLGAGYETISGTVADGAGVFNREMLNVGPREMFFDDSSNSLELEQYDMDFKLEISYDVDFLLTSIKNGYQKWQAQSISGTDDPQTQHTYATRFKTVGSIGSKDIELLSSFVAAGLTIEQGRRMSEVFSQDWPLDEDTFIIQANGSLSPDQVKVYSNDVVEGIENGDTRYNLRLTPASNFNRWVRWLSIGFQNYVGDLFTFVDGEGNTTMVFDNPSATGCEAEPGTYADESGDIEVTDAIMQPLLYKFSVPFTWENYKAVRNNRRQSIQLNYFDNEGEDRLAVLFIRSLKYDPNKSEAEFECWLKRTAIAEVQLTASLVGFGTWNAQDAGLTGVVTLTGPADSDSVEITSTGTVDIIAQKATNAGLAEGDGFVKFYKNGVLEPGSDPLGTPTNAGTITFTLGQNCGSVSHIYTDVDFGDTLRVEIEEIP